MMCEKMRATFKGAGRKDNATFHRVGRRYKRVEYGQYGGYGGTAPSRILHHLHPMAREPTHLSTSIDTRQGQIPSMYLPVRMACMYIMLIHSLFG